VTLHSSTVVGVTAHFVHGGYMASHGIPPYPIHILTCMKVDGGPFILEVEPALDPWPTQIFNKVPGSCAEGGQFC